MAAYTYNPSTQKTEAHRHVFEASPVYTMSIRRARVKQRNPVSKSPHRPPKKKVMNFRKGPDMGGVGSWRVGREMMQLHCN